MIALLVAWGLVLLGTGYLSSRQDRPTVREQRTVAQAAPAVDRAAGELAAAGGPGAVLDVSDRDIESGCRISVVRRGVTLSRTVHFYTEPAAAPGLLDSIAARLPASYGARVWHGDGVAAHTLRADAGDFVAIRGAVTEPGVVALTASTGCRPAAGIAGWPTREDRWLRSDVTPVLAALGAGTSGTGPQFSAPCPGGGEVLTDRVVATRAANGPPLPSALAGVVSPARPVVATAQLYAYRSGVDSVVVEASGSAVTVTVSRGCPGR